MLLKGSATLARMPSLIELRLMADVDLLIPIDAVTTAIRAVEAIGFKSVGVETDALNAFDLDDLHALSFAKLPFEDFDIHWHPVRSLRDPRLANEMFAGAEMVDFQGLSARVPALADHIFHLLAHGIDANDDVRIDFMVEVGTLIEANAEAIDWRRFCVLADRYGLRERLHEIMARLRDDLAIAFPSTAFPRREPRRLGMVRRFPKHDRPEASSDFGAVISAYGAWRRRHGKRSHIAAIGRLVTDSRMRHRLAWAAIAALPGGDEIAAARAAAWGQGASRDGYAPIATRPLMERTVAHLAGFSFPEEFGRWTEGCQSALLIPTGTPAKTPTPVVLIVAPFLPMSDDAMTVATATGIDRATVPLLPHQPSPTRLVLVGLTDEIGDVSVGLSIAGAQRPGIGSDGSRDSRLLGLQLQSANAVILEAVPIPTELGPDSPCLLFAQGFSVSETQGRWTDGPTARFVCRVADAPPQGLRLQLQFASAYAPEDRAIIVSAGVWGHRKLASTEVAHGRTGSLTFSINAEDICHDGHIVVVVSIQNCPTRCDAVHSADPRQLGVLLEKIIILPGPLQGGPSVEKSSSALTSALRWFELILA
jgi:Uncharacterised nucleotidyltransferase